MSEWKKVKIDFATIKLGDYIEPIKTTVADTGDKNPIVYGVSNKDGISQTGKPASKDISNYIVLEKDCFAFNPYRINVGSIGVNDENLKGCVSPAYVVFKTKNGLLPKFLYFYLKSDYGIHLINWYGNRGGVRNALRYSDLCKIDIPDIRHLNQEKLLKTFSSAWTQIEELNKEIEKQKNYAKQLRQNILQEAIEGKLTADWRKQHPVQKGNPDYDAQALLDCLQQKKESLKKDPLVKREKIRTPVGDTEKEFSIPNNWIWIRMGELCYPITKGTTPDVHEIKADGEIPYLKMFNIVNQKLDFDYRPQYISKKVHDEKLTRSKVYPNDVIMNIVGPPMGKIAMVTDEFPEWNLNQAMAIFRGYDISINPYIYVFLNSMIWFKYVHTLGVVGQENMSLEQCKDIAVALPPLAEQKEIVARVEQHLQTIAQLETQITTRETTTKQLMQSILKDAFGEG